MSEFILNLVRRGAGIVDVGRLRPSIAPIAPIGPLQPPVAQEHAEPRVDRTDVLDAAVDHPEVSPRHMPETAPESPVKPRAEHVAVDGTPLEPAERADFVESAVARHVPAGNQTPQRRESSASGNEMGDAPPAGELSPRVPAIASNDGQKIPTRPSHDTGSSTLARPEGLPGKGPPLRASAVRVRPPPSEPVPALPLIEQSVFRTVAAPKRGPTTASGDLSRPSSVQIRIGRVDVRAISPPALTPVQRTTLRSEPALTLDEYLKQRREGRR